MDKILVKKIKFTSFMKLFYAISISLGITMGILGFVVGLFNGPVNVSLGTNVYTGFIGGILGLIVFPFLSLIFGTILGLIAYLPFRLLIKLKKGLSFYIEIENIEAPNIEINVERADLDEENKQV